MVCAVAIMILGAALAWIKWRKTNDQVALYDPPVRQVRFSNPPSDMPEGLRAPILTDVALDTRAEAPAANTLPEDPLFTPLEF